MDFLVYVVKRSLCLKAIFVENIIIYHSVITFNKLSNFPRTISRLFYHFSNVQGDLRIQSFRTPHFFNKTPFLVAIVREGIGF